MQIPRHVFRAYDIRGIAEGPDAEITPDLARAVGLALAAMLRDEWRASQAVVGGDLRATTPALREALIAGIRDGGCDVVAIGDVPSPLAYWAAAKLAAEEQSTAAAIVTASHNPPDENGIKLIGPDALPFLPEQIGELGGRAADASPAQARGALREWNPLGEYVRSLAAEYSLPAPIRVALDPGNAVPARTAPAAFTEISTDSADVAAINLDPSQHSHPADPAEAENVRELEQFVNDSHSQIGFAFDGDGDRLGLVLPNGRVSPHSVLALLARIHLEEHPGAQIHVDVKTSQAVINDIEAHGGSAIMGRVGHSFAKRRMHAEGIDLGGEASTHYYLGLANPPHVTDDAVRTACLLAHRAALRHLPSEIADIPRYQTSPEVKVPCEEGRKSQIMQALSRELARNRDVNTIDGIRAQLSEIEPGAWLLVRPSNTTPNLTVTFEARTIDGFKQVRVLAHDLIRAQGLGAAGIRAAEPLA